MANKWIRPKHNPDGSSCLEKAGIPSGIQDILYNRGYTSVPEILQYLRPSLFDLYSPFLFCDMDKVIQRLEKAYASREKILIYGDYDADGVTGTALLYKVLNKFGFNVLVHIPTREEGYGLHQEVIRKAAAAGVGLIITVDCGITAVREVLEAAEAGIDTIITDHHEASETIPSALAILNPMVQGSGYPFPFLAGVGVAFKLAQAIFSRFPSPDDQPGSELAFLDLAALGTIADVVPLTGENRILVKYGLQVMEKTVHAGIRAILTECGLWGKKLKSGQISFSVAPRINAAGRMDTARLALNLLLEENLEEALANASMLTKENQERQLTEKNILRQAEKLLEGSALPEVIVLSSPDWHHGVIGIVASRLAEKYNRPVFLIAEEGENGKGSARGINGYHVLHELEKTAALLDKFGGHKMAAGFSLPVQNIAHLRRALITNFKESGLQLEQQYRLEAVVPFQNIDLDLVEELEQMAPFGAENPAPLLLTEDLAIKRLQPVGKESDHLKLILGKDQGQLEVMAYKKGKEYTLFSNCQGLDIVYSLEINDYGGQRKPQAVLKDYRPAGRPSDALEAVPEVAESLDRRETAAVGQEEALPGITRQMLVVFYKQLRSLEQDKVIVFQPGLSVAEGSVQLQMEMLKILEELGIVTWLGGTGPYLLRLNSGQKADLADSLRFRVLRQSGSV